MLSGKSCILIWKAYEGAKQSKKKKIPLRHIIDTEEHEGWVFNNKYVPHWSEHSGAWAGTRQFSWGQCWRVRTHLSKIMALPSRFILLVRISDCHHYCLFWMVTPSLSYLGYPQDGRPERAPPGVAVSDTGILPSDWPLPERHCDLWCDITILAQSVCQLSLLRSAKQFPRYNIFKHSQMKRSY